MQNTLVYFDINDIKQRQGTIIRNYRCTVIMNESPVSESTADNSHTLGDLVHCSIEASRLRVNVKGKVGEVEM